MLSSLQPSRPQIQPAPATINPLGQQQIRQQHFQQQSAQPSNQLGAMPPHRNSIVPTAVPPRPPPAAYNPATTHPVFFTPWRKAPFPIPPGAGFNPITTGYVFEDRRKRSHSMTKL